MVDKQDYQYYKLLQYTFLSRLSQQIEVKLKNQTDYLCFYDYFYNVNQTENMTYP